MALTATPWQRYGKDRTYFTDESGEKVGWADNLTGEVTGQRDGGADEVRAWLARHPGQPAAEEVPAPDEDPVPDQREEPQSPLSVPEATVDYDLSLNRPGAAARAQAKAIDAQRKEEFGRFRVWAVKALDFKTEERAWRIGADAEETVGAELGRLAKHGWHVLHAVPIGTRGSDIDHVLIGPGGVITVNTKHHPDGKVWVTPRQIRVNGSVQPYLRNSRFEAERTARLLTEAVGFPVPVVACLVFRLGDGSLTVKEDPGDVLIYRATKAYKALRENTGILSPDQVEAVYQKARWQSTWVS